MRIINQAFYCSFNKFFPKLQFQANFNRDEYPSAYAVRDKLRS